MLLRLVSWSITFFLITDVSYAQFVPLDINEAFYRTLNSPTIIEYVDTSSNGMGSDISLALQDGVSIFLLPSFNKSISKTISYHHKLVLTSNPNYGSRIGSTYERSGNFSGSRKPGDISILDSYLSYKLGNAILRFGKYSPWDGQGRLSYNANHFQLPPIQGFEYHYAFKRIGYTHGNYWLGYSSANDDDQGLSRFYATQKIEYKRKDLVVEVGNRVIYAGLNQTYNWRYAVPLDPFIISIFNFGAPQNIDNQAIHMSVVYNVTGKLKIIGKLIVDEFQIDSADRLLDDDEYGVQLSLIYCTGNKFFQSVSINHIKTTDYFGIHYGKSLNYEVQGLPILSQYGPQYERNEIIQNYSFFNRHFNGWISLFGESLGQNEILGTPWKPNPDTSIKRNMGHVLGFEAEMMSRFGKNIYGFGSFTIAEKRKPLYSLSVIYSIKL